MGHSNKSYYFTNEKIIISCEYCGSSTICENPRAVNLHKKLHTKMCSSDLKKNPDFNTDYFKNLQENSTKFKDSQLIYY
jgi:hypothetical protein